MDSLKKLERLRVRVALLTERDWDPAEHPRGKTTPKSRGGSFAPKGVGDAETKTVDSEGVTHVGNFVELYHGTSARRANKILKEGFSIRAVRKQTMSGDSESNRNYIWFAKRLEHASSYAKMHLGAVVVTVRIPQDVYKRLNPYNHNSGPDSVWIREAIPPTYIHTTTKVNYG